MKLFKKLDEITINKRFRTFAGIDWSVPVARLTRLWTAEGTPISDATVGARTYTAAEILAGIIVRDPNGGSRSDVLPTAALLVAAIKQANGGKAVVGDVIRCLIVNGADAAEVITIGAGAGGGFDVNQVAASRVIGQNVSKVMHIRITGVLSGSEAYVVYL